MIFTRIRIFLRLTSLLFQTAVLNKKFGVFYKSCGFCKGVTHNRIDFVEDIEDGSYEAQFQCNKCGAFGTTKEQWRKSIKLRFSWERRNGE